MKAKELQDKSKEELQTLLLEKQARLCQLRFDVSARQVKNFREVPAVKKDIAKIFTILNNK